MNLPEDRHPLLYVYVDYENPEKVRNRYIYKGAATLLGKWPTHVTFTWMMGVVGLLSLLFCFFVTIILLVAPPTDIPFSKRLLTEKCNRDEHTVQFVHLKNLEDLALQENATYFVDIFKNEKEIHYNLCSIESLLKITTAPVFFVLIFPNETEELPKIFKELEKKYRNFVTVTFNFDDFYRKTLISNFPKGNLKFLKFLAKIFVAWNVGGTVIDPKLISVKNFKEMEKDDADAKDVGIGFFDDEVVFIRAKKFCRAFVFDLLKILLENKNVTELYQKDVIDEARNKFCRNNKKCVGVKIYPNFHFCSLMTRSANCTFVAPKHPELIYLASFLNYEKHWLCPLAGPLCSL